MTGPREELLSTGSLGPEGVALLYRRRLAKLFKFFRQLHRL